MTFVPNKCLFQHFVFSIWLNEIPRVFIFWTKQSIEIEKSITERKLKNKNESHLRLHTIDIRSNGDAPKRIVSAKKFNRCLENGKKYYMNLFNMGTKLRKRTKKNNIKNLAQRSLILCWEFSRFVLARIAIIPIWTKISHKET